MNTQSPWPGGSQPYFAGSSAFGKPAQPSAGFTQPQGGFPPNEFQRARTGIQSGKSAFLPSQSSGFSQPAGFAQNSGSFFNPAGQSSASAFAPAPAASFGSVAPRSAQSDNSWSSGSLFVHQSAGSMAAPVPSASTSVFGLDGSSGFNKPAERASAQKTDRKTAPSERRKERKNERREGKRDDAGRKPEGSRKPDSSGIRSERARPNQTKAHSKVTIPNFSPGEYVFRKRPRGDDMSILKPLPKPLTSVHSTRDLWDVQNQNKLSFIENKYLNRETSLQSAYETMAKMREEERHEMEKRKLVDNTQVRKNLTEAILFVGSCLEMCPVFERVRRAHENNALSFEKDSQGRVIRERAVKAFSRPAAGQPPPLPSDVRPPKVLVSTLHYLVAEILPQLPSSHPFLWDRTRSIRQDFTYQNYQGQEAIQCFEIIARIHCVSLHRMAKASLEGAEWSQQQELEQFNKCLQSLSEFYQNQPLVSPNEPEIRAYQLLSHLFDDEMAALVDRSPPQISSHPLVNLALELRSLAVVSSQGFMARARKPDVPPTFRAVAETHYNALRVRAVRRLIDSMHRQLRMYSFSRFIALLGFETTEGALRFCDHYGLRIERDASGTEEVDIRSWNEASIKDKQALGQSFDFSLDQAIEAVDVEQPLITSVNLPTNNAAKSSIPRFNPAAPSFRPSGHAPATPQSQAWTSSRASENVGVPESRPSQPHDSAGVQSNASRIAAIKAREAELRAKLAGQRQAQNRESPASAEPLVPLNGFPLGAQPNVHSGPAAPAQAKVTPASWPRSQIPTGEHPQLTGDTGSALKTQQGQAETQVSTSQRRAEAEKELAKNRLAMAQQQEEEKAARAKQAVVQQRTQFVESVVINLFSRLKSDVCARDASAMARSITLGNKLTLRRTLHRVRMVAEESLRKKREQQLRDQELQQFRSFKGAGKRVISRRLCLQDLPATPTDTDQRGPADINPPQFSSEMPRKVDLTPLNLLFSKAKSYGLHKIDFLADWSSSDGIWLDQVLGLDAFVEVENGHTLMLKQVNSFRGGENALTVVDASAAPSSDSALRGELVVVSQAASLRSSAILRSDIADALKMFVELCEKSLSSHRALTIKRRRISESPQRNVSSRDPSPVPIAPAVRPARPTTVASYAERLRRLVDEANKMSDD